MLVSAPARLSFASPLIYYVFTKTKTTTSTLSLFVLRVPITNSSFSVRFVYRWLMKRLSPCPPPCRHLPAIVDTFVSFLPICFRLEWPSNGSAEFFLVGKLTGAVRRDPDLVYNVSLLLVSPSSFVERQEIGQLLMPSTHLYDINKKAIKSLKKSNKKVQTQEPNR